MKNVIVINFSSFDVTDYASWTMLFPFFNKPHYYFINLDGKRSIDLLYKEIQLKIKYVKRNFPTRQNFKIIIFFPDKSYCAFWESKNLKDDEINLETELVCFQSNCPLQDYSMIYKVSVNTKEVQGSVWNYAKYSFSMFYIIQKLLAGSDVKVVDSENFKMQVSHKESTRTTSIDVYVLNVYSMLKKYKHYLEYAKRPYEVVEEVESIDLFNLEDSHNLNFTQLKQVFKNAFDSFDDIKVSSEYEKVIEGINNLYKNLDKYLRTLKSVVENKNGLFVSNHIIPNDMNKLTLELKNDRQSNTHELNEAMDKYKLLLKKYENEHKETLQLPKVTNIELENLEITKGNVIGEITNLIQRLPTLRVLGVIAIISLFGFIISSLLLIINFNANSFLIIIGVFLVVFLVTIVSSYYVLTRQIRQKVNEQIHEFVIYKNNLLEASQVNIERIQKQLNSRKAMVENINILTKFKNERLLFKERKNNLMDNVILLLKMKDVQDVEPAKYDIKGEVESLSITELFKKELLNG